MIASSRWWMGVFGQLWNVCPDLAEWRPLLPFLSSAVMLQAASQAASAWFASSQILQNYAIAGSPGSTAGGSPFHVGPWRVQEASHKTTQKRASVWTCEKRNPELERLGAGAKDAVIGVLKMEVGGGLPAVGRTHLRSQRSRPLVD